MSRPQNLPSPTFPPEVLTLIVGFVIPAPSPIALPPSHPVAKTLRNLAYSSRLLHSISMPFIYSHCVYLDNFSRLSAFTIWLLGVRAREDADSGRNWADKALYTPVLKHITALYIGLLIGSSYASEGHVIQICRLLELLDHFVVKRLVLVVPQRRFDYFNPEDDTLAPLRATLMKFKALEVFSSSHSDILTMTSPRKFMPKDEVPWTHWPNLRVLAFWDLSPHPGVWIWWQSMKKLERVFCTGFRLVLMEDYHQDLRLAGCGESDQKKLEIFAGGQEIYSSPGKELETTKDLLQVNCLDVYMRKNGPFEKVYFDRSGGCGTRR